jgi:hypothetical protein
MIVGKDIKGFLKKFFKKSSAQSFFISDASETQDLENLLIEHLTQDNISFLDLHKFEEPNLKIEDAREIHWRASQSSHSGVKIFLIKSRSIAQEAQATLLKTIEEPHSGSYFIFSSIPELQLTRPLLSRLTVFKRLIRDREKIPTLKVSLQDVIKYSESRESAENFLNKLEAWADEKVKKSAVEPSRELTSFIEDLYEARARFYEKTYPPKMLLEHLVISKFYLES